MLGFSVHNTADPQPNNEQLLANVDFSEPIVQTVVVDPAKYEPRLAANNRRACADCRGGDDGLPRFLSNTGASDTVNTPTVFNVALNFRFAWYSNSYVTKITAPLSPLVHYASSTTDLLII